ncbi:alpha/beta hydrolase [Actinoalloteichus hymeniacidonis]|uniref:Alpha/beta hydrolase family protein n=1 Tax=Actinoalloteichus hymeniacidonis TaxID=340345 RepID=A0AAC9HMW6_9PSEU|nr:alpha/beta fold hydrolase [Actinoalloteichus hymeniacidonis]AOS62064.1 Alpha/beta hydrolase family protein [Actinoalloteichus hymeniacidonis]MBB5909914.1 hypothetical protein [Actinoalloteichus hymeniacidonis]
MTITADDGTALAGTLSLPIGPGPHPTVLLLHGSGPLDRDGNAAKLRSNIGPELATALAAKGIGMLRYDRRGAGATPGDWQRTGFYDNRRDAAAAITALAAHPDVRTDSIGVIGHSEGALHAMALAAQDEVRAVVLLAGFAGVGEDALRWQARSVIQGMPAPVRLLRRPAEALLNRVLNRLKNSTTDVVRIAGAPMNARWMREMLTHDTRKDLVAAKAEVLAITGDKDIQVDPADLIAIERLVPGAVEIHRSPDLTHILRRDSGTPSLRSYRRLFGEPVDPDLLSLVGTWLRERLTATPNA